MKCDTPNYHARNNLDVQALQTHIESGHVDGISVCGKGEPTSRQNQEKLLYLLKVAKDNGLSVHAFINGLEITREMFDYIDDGTFNVLAQFNSLDAKNIIAQMGLEQLYGRNAEQMAKSQIENLHILGEIAKGKSSRDINIGASIVPETYNEHELGAMFDFCLERGMSILVGELENAGKSTGETYNELVIPKKRLLLVQDMMAERGIPTQTPLCPYLFSSVHVSNNNRVSADKTTGSSCSWWNLQDNNMAKKIYFGNIADKSFEQFSDEIMAHRMSIYPNLKELSQQDEMPLIGGCGGNTNDVMRILTETTASAIKTKGSEMVD